MSLIDIRAVDHIAAAERAVHRHARGQLFTALSGLLSIEVEGGRWVMPPGCLGWVPSGRLHGADAHGEMRGLNMYFTEDWGSRHMPAEITVVRQSPLLHALLDALQGPERLPAEQEAHYLAVFADAFKRQPPQTLFLPMPRDARLVRIATDLLVNPDDNTDLDGWAERIGMSRRTLTRHFQQETGWSLAQWRQQMRLTLALERLSAGESVTSVALGLGYASVSSFIAVFRRFLGATPKAYMSLPQVA